MTNTVRSGDRARVLVVGAGPVGLSAALALRARGLAVTVLEAEPADRVRPGSRAIFVHRESLEQLETMMPGLGRDMAAHGEVWRTKRTTWRGRDVFTRTYAPLVTGTLPPFTSLPQVETERILLEACKTQGVDFAWNSAVTGVDSTPSGVAATTEDGITASGDYLIGADGARSAVRQAIGTDMRGSRSPNSFVIVDVDSDPEDPLPRERVFHYEHPAMDGRHVLFVPFSGGWRVDLQCDPADEPEEFSGIDGVRRWLPRVMNASYADRVSWVSTYQFLQVLADRFTDEHRRVLLVGEAAHLFAPFGARGMNSGISDAATAAAAIDTAVGSGEERVANAAVDEFASVRREAARYNRDAAGQALAHMRGDDRRTRTKQRLAAALAPRVSRAGSWLDAAPYGPRSGPAVGKAGRY